MARRVLPELLLQPLGEPLDTTAHARVQMRHTLACLGDELLEGLAEDGRVAHGDRIRRLLAEHALQLRELLPRRAWCGGDRLVLAPRRAAPPLATLARLGARAPLAQYDGHRGHRSELHAGHLAAAPSGEPALRRGSRCKTRTHPTSANSIR